VINITRERLIIIASIFVVFLGFLTAVINGRSDHIYRTLVAMLGLSIPLVLSKKLPNPPEKVKPFLSPLYDEKTMAVLAVFIAVHVSLVNVPFTHYDLFHRDWRNADMISHFLGGMTVWLMITEVLKGLSDEGVIPREKVILYSFIAFYVIAVSWEIAEKLSETEISFIHETLANKFRDVIMDTLGALTGVWMVRKKDYPYSLED
jgi:hypothetical protein